MTGGNSDGETMEMKDKREAAVKRIEAGRRRGKAERGDVKKRIVKGVFNGLAKTWNTSHGGAPPLAGSLENGRGEQDAKPVPLPELPSTSSLITGFLQDLPNPTRNEPLAKHWYKVNINESVEHAGSVLFEDENQKGKWVAAELRSVVPL